MMCKKAQKKSIKNGKIKLLFTFRLLIQARKDSTRMSSNEELDQWLATVRECKFLPEPSLKKLCDRVFIQAHSS